MICSKRTLDTSRMVERCEDSSCVDTGGRVCGVSRLLSAQRSSRMGGRPQDTVSDTSTGLYLTLRARMEESIRCCLVSVDTGIRVGVEQKGGKEKPSA